MTNHRESGNDWLETAEGLPVTTISAALIAIGHYLGALLDEELEEPHQADKFEHTPLRAYPPPDDDADTVARPYGLGHIPDVDIVSGLASTWDSEPRTDAHWGYPMDAS